MDNQQELQNQKGKLVSSQFPTFSSVGNLFLGVGGWFLAASIFWLPSTISLLYIGLGGGSGYGFDNDLAHYFNRYYDYSLIPIVLIWLVASLTVLVFTVVLLVGYLRSKQNDSVRWLRKRYIGLWIFGIAVNIYMLIAWYNKYYYGMRVASKIHIMVAIVLLIIGFLSFRKTKKI